MKQFIAILTLLAATTTWAQDSMDTKTILDYWDGSFFYNRMTISESKFQDNILIVTLSGASMGIGHKMAGTTESLSYKNRVQVVITKDDCQIDVAAKTIQCERLRPTSADITWSVNPVLNQSFDGAIENIKIEGSPKQAKMSFEITPNEHFTSNEPVLEFVVDILFPTEL